MKQVLLAAIMFIAVGFSIPVDAIEASSRTAVIGGASVGEVVVDGQVPLRIRFSAGGLSPTERASVVADRLSAYPDLTSSDITVGRVGPYWAVLARGNLIVTADPVHAIANDTTTYGLALAWRDQLRNVVGGVTEPTPPVGTGPGMIINTDQKAVPIISVGSGLRVGVALVAGSSDQVSRVNAVAQIEGQFGRSVRARVLVPVDTEDVISSIRRVPGTAVVGVAYIRL